MPETWTCYRCGHVNTGAGTVSGISFGRESFTDFIGRAQQAAEASGVTRCASCGRDRFASDKKKKDLEARKKKQPGAGDKQKDGGGLMRRLFGRQG